MRFRHTTHQVVSVSHEVFLSSQSPKGDQWSPEKLKMHLKKDGKTPTKSTKPNRLQNTVPETLRRHRLLCGFSQAYVASQLLVSVRTVKYWESGRKLPKPLRLQFLFEFLEVPLSERLRSARPLGSVREPVSDLDPFRDA